MSTALLLLAGCAAHLGTIPASGGWALTEVAAPVAEPDVDVQVRAALLDALAARRALANDGSPLRATVLEAAYVPSRRSGDVLVYEARLTVRLDAGERTVTRQRARLVSDPGDAAGGRAAREAAFRELARQVAEDGVSWLLQ